MSLIDKYHLTDPVCETKLKKSELIISTIAINIMSLALPIMALQIYDRILVNHHVSTLYMLSIGVCVAIILETILRITRSYAVGWNGVLYEYTMSANALRRYIDADHSKLVSGSTGERLQSLNAFNKLRDFYSGQVLITLIDIPFLIIFLILIAYLTGWLVLTPLFLILITTYATWLIGNELIKDIKEQSYHEDKRYNFIIETLQGIHSIKAYGVESLLLRRYEILKESSSLSNYKTAILAAQGRTFGIFVNEAMIISVVAIGAPMVINHDLTVGTLIATILLSGRLMQPIQKALFLWSQYQDYRIAYQKAETIFSIEQIQRSKHDVSSTKEGNLRLENVEYSEGKKNLLRDINLDLTIPEVVAIHGHDGNSKSTLLRLIAGVIAPTNGQVLVNNHKTCHMTSAEIIKHVGLITADSIMFHGTIMENLTRFDKSYESSAMELSNILGIDKSIELLPKGYDTKINDNVADIIAPGVKQRISIVRVLLEKPKIILFDNADKDLDKDGYNHLVKLLHLLKGKTTIIIATDDHNISNLASKHYLLKDSTLTQIEDHDSSVFKVQQYQELKI